MKREPMLHIGFAPWMVAGVRTQWENMLPYLRERPHITPHIVEISPYKYHGRLEALPLMPPVVRGNIRTVACGAQLLRLPRLDALWTHEIRAVLPFLLSRAEVPVVYASDSTSSQQADFGSFYAKAPSGSRRARLRDELDRFGLRRVQQLQPWSEWAARSLRDDHHIAPARVRIIPPGIDLRRWKPIVRQREPGTPLRLLFVGGDFKRKGGELLLEVFERRLQQRCELHLVTREPVRPTRGVHIYPNLQPNDRALRDLYEQADIFVLPTLADCFSLASLEAMATGLPVIASNVGGIPEIVADGRSGFTIDPGDGAALSGAIEALLDTPERRLDMGQCGRLIVEDRFDAARTTSSALDALEELCRSRPVRRA